MRAGPLFSLALGLLACETSTEPAAPVDLGVDAAPDAPVDGAEPDAAPPDAAPPDAAPPDAAVGCAPEVVAVGAFSIFRYEASEPEAGCVGAGSAPGRLPWVSLTPDQAEAACQAAGFSLCTDEQWQTACGGAGHWIFPYGAAHSAGRCNDHLSGTGALQPTGSAVDCHTPDGIYDLSGNVWELTRAPEGHSRRGASYRVNAALYQEDAARCDVYYFSGEGYSAEDVGFRCCREDQSARR